MLLIKERKMKQQVNGLTPTPHTWTEVFGVRQQRMLSHLKKVTQLLLLVNLNNVHMKTMKVRKEQYTKLQQTLLV